MKWLSKVFQRGDVDVDIEPIHLELSQVLGWLKDREQQIDLKEVAGICSRIAQVALDMKTDLISLKSSIPTKAVSPRLLRAGLAARETVVKQLEVLCNTLSPPDTLTIDSAATYYTDLVRQMERMGNHSMRAYGYSAAIFPQEIEAISSDNSSLSRLLIELGEVIQNKQRERMLCFEAKELASRVLDGQTRIQQTLLEIEKNRKKLEEMSQRERQLEENVASMDDMETLRASLDAKRCQQRDVEMEVAKIVGPLSKAISRALKQDARERLNLEHRGTLEILSSSPHKALERDLGPPLKELRSSLPSLGLKDKMKDKVQESIDSILAVDIFQDLKIRWISTAKEVEKLENSLDKRIRIGDEEEVIRIRNSRAELEDKIQKDEALLISIEEEFKVNRTALQKMTTRIAGSPVLIANSSTV